MTISFGPRRAISVDITQQAASTLNAEELRLFESFDLIYRSLCAVLYNYVPTSGHPGGSISSGRFVASLLYDAMDYDFSDPDRAEADVISYAAGHKALGLYAMWALRNEIARVGAPELLPKSEKLQLRLEDLLGFRRNPINPTPLFKKFNAKPLDGHPTPATPFLKLSTGASGVGFAASLGLAMGAADYYAGNAPRVHIVEGEGGLTPGRVAEAMAFAGTASLKNAIVHLDWNQASIDSDHVTRERNEPGDYVQWDPMEFFYLHDWNVVYVPDGKDFKQVVAAQRYAQTIENGQPTAIVYRTVKGWQYGIEGRASHGAGHKMCSAGFYDALQQFTQTSAAILPTCEIGAQRCAGGADAAVVEGCFWESLTILRNTIAENEAMVKMLASRLRDSKARLDKSARIPRQDAPAVDKVYEASAQNEPAELKLAPGTSTTLRGQLGKVLDYLNRASGGSILVSAADLLGSTSINEGAKGFASGFYNATKNPASRTLSIGGICEDGMSGILSGVSSYGHHIGIGSSYGAFLAPLGHIAARLHAIGNQARHAISPDPYKPMILICAHAGLKTGEDGPTHADPQPLQILQENFPAGTNITLTPWDPQETWPLVSAALGKRPAVITPFVTRPNEPVLDRAAAGLAPATAAATGVYKLRAAKGTPDAVVVLQESGITYEFVRKALPLLDQAGFDVEAYYVASAELFDLLPQAERDAIFPESKRRVAMGITGFTLATMYRWVQSDLGRKNTLHPFMKGHFLGSGAGEMVIAEAGLDGNGQFEAIVKYAEQRRAAKAETAAV